MPMYFYIHITTTFTTTKQNYIHIFYFFVLLQAFDLFYSVYLFFLFHMYTNTHTHMHMHAFTIHTPMNACMQRGGQNEYTFITFIAILWYFKYFLCPKRLFEFYFSCCFLGFFWHVTLLLLYILPYIYAFLKCLHTPDKNLIAYIYLVYMYSKCSHYQAQYMQMES